MYHEDKELMAIYSGFIVKLGQPVDIEGTRYFPVVYDDLSSEIIAEDQLHKRFTDAL